MRASIPLNLGVRMWKPNPKFSWPFWPNPGEARGFPNPAVEIMSCVLIPLMFSETSQQLHTCSNDIVACGCGRCLWDVNMQTKRATYIYIYPPPNFRWDVVTPGLYVIKKIHKLGVIEWGCWAPFFPNIALATKCPFVFNNCIIQGHIYPLISQHEAHHVMLQNATAIFMLG